MTDEAQAIDAMAQAMAYLEFGIAFDELSQSAQRKLLNLATDALRALLGLTLTTTCSECGGTAWTQQPSPPGPPVADMLGTVQSTASIAVSGTCPAGCVDGRVPSGRRYMLGEQVGWIAPTHTRKFGYVLNVEPIEAAGEAPVFVEVVSPAHSEEK